MIQRISLYVSFGLFLLTIFVHSYDLSFTNDTLDSVWLLVCSLVWIVSLAIYLHSKVSVLWQVVLTVIFSLALLLYFADFYRNGEAYYFEDNKIVKAYTVILGFTDAESDYRISQKLQYLPFLEKYRATASGRGKNYIYLKAKPLALTKTHLILVYPDLGKDSLQLEIRKGNLR